MAALTDGLLLSLMKGSGLAEMKLFLLWKI
jgi:hypothetical protein